MMCFIVNILRDRRSVIDLLTTERFVGTRVTAPTFSYLRTIEDGNERMVGQTGIESVTS